MNGLGALQNYVTGGEVSQAYREILGRAPDTGGLQFYTNPNLSLADLKAQLAGSEEGRAFLASQAPTGSAAAMQGKTAVAPGTMGAGVQPTTVADLYTKYLGREADPGGLESWTKQFGPTVDANELARFLGAASTKAEMANLPLQQLNTNTSAATTTGGTGATTGATTGGASTAGTTDTGGASQMTVEDLYGDYLKREADQGGLEYWKSRFGPTVDATELAAFLNDPATKTELAGATTNVNTTDTSTNTNTNDGGTTIDTSGSSDTGGFGKLTNAILKEKYGKDVDSLFQSLLGRLPTADDYSYYGGLLNSGTPINQIKSDISGTTESLNWLKSQTVAAKQGTQPVLNRSQINEMYLKTLGRAGDPGGLDYYQGQNVTRDQLVNSMLGSQEFRVPTGIQAIAPRREAATLQGPTDFGTPAYMGGTPMAPVTAKDLGTKFVAPEDYAAVFTPETTYTTQDPLLTEAPASTETAEPLAGGGYIGENPEYSEYMAGQAEGGSVNMARGGRVPQSHGLRNVAQHLASKGRGEDSMLVHMTPEEVRGLRALAHAQGHDLPINPHTGLPEAGWFSKLFRNIMKVVPFVLPFTGLGVLASAGISGLAGATSGGGFNLKKGLMSGLMSYGIGSLSEAAKGASAASSAASAASSGASAADAAKSLVDPSQIGQGYGSIAKDYIAANTAPLAVQGAGSAAKAGIDATMQGGNLAATEAAKAAAAEAATKGIASNIAPAVNAAAMASQPAANVASQAIANPNLINKGLTAASDFSGRALDATKDIGKTAYGLATDPAARKTFAETMARNAAEGPNLGLQNALTATSIGASGLVAANAEEKYAKEAADIKAAEDEKTERMRQRVYEIMRSNPLPQNYSMAGGGLAAFAKGGNSATAPRMLDGPGDGMSDSIPAMIGDKQPARLADGEFVIPADIVSHLGNGSSKAGSKQLYAMMDRIRKARTGRSSQAPEVRATKLMPA